MARNRTLAQANNKILRNSNIIETTLSDLLAQGHALQVLEIGFGEGRALLELAWRFQDYQVAFYGVNKKPSRAVKNCEDLRDTARRYAIIPAPGLANFRWPEVFFYDAGKLHFDDESLDLVYSVMTMRFIERKAEFLEEICRVLKPGGRALLDVGGPGWEYPYSFVCHDKMLTPYFSRFVLKYGHELIPLPSYLQLFADGSLQIRFINLPRCVMAVSKIKSSQLRLQLTFNDILSLPMRELPYSRIGGKDRGGFRSVYDIRPEIYPALFEAGLLSRDQLCLGDVLPESYADRFIS